MAENPQEVEKAPERQGSLVLMLVSLFVAVYLILPQVVVYPVYLVYRGDYPPGVSAAITILFYPDIMLAGTVPAYRSLLKQEARLLGMR